MNKKSVFIPIVEPLTLEDITLEDALKLLEYLKKKKWNKSWSNKTTKFKKTKQVKSKSAK